MHGELSWQNMLSYNYYKKPVFRINHYYTPISRAAMKTFGQAWVSAAWMRVEMKDMRLLRQYFGWRGQSGGCLVSKCETIDIVMWRDRKTIGGKPNEPSHHPGANQEILKFMEGKYCSRPVQWQTWWCYAWVILSQSKQTKLKFYPCLVSAMLGVLSSLGGGMLSRLSLEQYLAYFWTFHPRQTSLKLVSLVAIFWEWVDFKALKQISVVSNCHNSWREKSVQSFISQDWLFIREPKATLAMVGAWLTIITR